MDDDRRDPSLLIGLHKLAQHNGDGLVPELYELLNRRPDELPEGQGIVRFPIGRTRPPTVEPLRQAEGNGATILPLRRSGR